MDFVPYVAISQQIRDEKTEDCKLPSYFLPDRSYYTTETKAEFKLCLSTDTQAKLGKTDHWAGNESGRKENCRFPIKNRKAILPSLEYFRTCMQGLHRLQPE